MKAFGMTTTATRLSADGMKLRLENPASVFSPGRGCKSPPYVLPDKNGGFITLVEYGEPECAEGCATPKPDGGCGCGGGCKPAAPKCEAGPKMPGDGQLLRYEEIAYSGYDTDDQTLILTERAVDGLTEQEWPAGTLVLQSGAAAYISQLEKLGCLLGVQKARNCLAVKKGEWVADPTCQCWRRAKKDAVVTSDDQGALNFPDKGSPENNEWSKCYGINDLLNLLNNPLCNQAWMLPKQASGDGGAGADKVNFVAHSGGSWADVVGQFQRYESQNNPIKKVLLTEADLVAIGMRPTDNRVQVEMFSYVNVVVDEANNDVGGQVSYNTTGTVKIYSPGGGSVSLSSGANVSMGELDGGNDADRDSGTEWVTLGASRELCIVYEATFSKTPGGIVINPANEPYKFAALNRRQWGKVRGFAAWDTGDFTAKGGCESQGPNQ